MRGRQVHERATRVTLVTSSSPIATYAALTFSPRPRAIISAPWVHQSGGLSCIFLRALPLPARLPLAVRPEFRSDSGRDRGTGPPQFPQGLPPLAGRTCRKGITSGERLRNSPMGCVSDLRLVRHVGLL